MSELTISTIDHFLGIAHPKLTGTELGGTGLVEISPAVSGPDVATNETVSESAVSGILLNRWVTDVKFKKGRTGVDVPATAGVPSGGQVKGVGESTFELSLLPEADGFLTELFDRFVVWDEHPLLIAQFHGGGGVTRANPQTRARVVILSNEDGGSQGAVKTHSFSGTVHGRVMTWNGTDWKLI